MTYLSSAKIRPLVDLEHLNAIWNNVYRRASPRFYTTSKDDIA